MIELSGYPLSEWHVLEIKGKFVVKNLTKVRVVLEELEQNQIYYVAIDLSQTVQLDSSALTILINYKKRNDFHNGKLLLVEPNKLIADIFSLISFEKVIPIISSLEEFRRTYAGR